MPLPPAHNTVRVAVRQSLGDDLDVLNIFHYQLNAAGPYNATQLDAVAEGFFAEFASHFMPFLSDQLLLQEATAHDISVVNGGDGVWVPPGGPIAGGSSDTPLPASVAAVISWGEFISYRGGHPRTYLAGIPKGQQLDPQHVQTSYATSLTTSANGFISDSNANTHWATPEPGELVVVHYRLNKIVQNPPVIFSILTGTVKTQIRSQRRRLQG